MPTLTLPSTSFTRVPFPPRDEIQDRIVQEMLYGLFHAFLKFPEYERLTAGFWGTLPSCGAAWPWRLTDGRDCTTFPLIREHVPESQFCC
jgi:hypothetical protein